MVEKDMVIAGSMNVYGPITTIKTTNHSITDRLIDLNSHDDDDNSLLDLPSGIIIENAVTNTSGEVINAAIVYDPVDYNSFVFAKTKSNDTDVWLSDIDANALLPITAKFNGKINIEAENAGDNERCYYLLILIVTIIK